MWVSIQSHYGCFPLRQLLIYNTDHLIGGTHITCHPLVLSLVFASKWVQNNAKRCHVEYSPSHETYHMGICSPDQRQLNLFCFLDVIFKRFFCVFLSNQSMLWKAIFPPVTSHENEVDPGDNVEHELSSKTYEACFFLYIPWWIM